MTVREVFMAGLPDAGKTTFVAALWHLVFSRDSEVELAFDSIEGLDVGYLYQLRAAWLQAKEPERTKIGLEKTAVLNLKSRAGNTLKLSLEDLAGEGFRQMWTRRRASAKVAELAQRADRHLLLINIAKVIYPRTSDELRQELGGVSSGGEIPFDPKKCPTAVQVTDVLQHLTRAPIDAKPAKIAIALTAWDEVDKEGKDPAGMLTERLPLVAQFIDANSELAEFKLYGVSAQGASYSNPEARDGALAKPKQSDRILLVDGSDRSHDLTRMLSWLLD